MTPLASLWLPILVAAVAVFVMSSLVHMLLKYHAADYRRLPNEEEVRTALRAGNVTPGQYVLPHCADHREMGSDEMTRKYTEGPVGLLWLQAPKVPRMGASLGGWFLYLLVVSLFVGYAVSITVAPGFPALLVFRVAGTVAFLAYAGAAASGSIWMGKPWRVTLLEGVDGLLYAVVTGGVFGWLWPR